MTGDQGQSANSKAASWTPVLCQVDGFGSLRAQLDGAYLSTLCKTYVKTAKQHSSCKHLHPHEHSRVIVSRNALVAKATAPVDMPASKLQI